LGIANLKRRSQKSESRIQNSQEKEESRSLELPAIGYCIFSLCALRLALCCFSLSSYNDATCQKLRIFAFTTRNGEALNRDMQTDVLVVGAGPAGCLAAVELARQGVNVLVVERSPFPREKVCGDGILEDSLAVLESVGLDAAVKEKAHPIRSILFVAPNGTECELEGNLFTLPRKELDALLLEEACSRGANFVGGVTVSEPLVQDGTCVGAVGFDQEGHKINITARLVLLATGANARILRVFGVLINRNHSAIGVRGYFRLTETIDESSMVVIYDRRLLPGYGWMFPLGQGVFNVGCVQPLSRHLQMAEQIEPIRAAPMRTGFQGARACAPGLLVLGEALGLTFPFIGEGVSSALESGRVAASVAFEALGRNDFTSRILGNYERNLRKKLDGRHQGYLAAQKLFHFKSFANLLITKAARNSSVRGVARQILLGQRDPEDVFSLRGMLRVLLLR
jgi:geranylgeranyl reductase family protein